MSTIGDNRLAVLAAEIQEADGRFRRSTEEAAAAAIEAGKLLLEAKELVGHGNWLPWLRDHCKLSGRTARRYMRLAESGMEIGHVANLGIAAADRALAAQEAADAVEKEGLDPETETLTKFMRMRGCRGTYGPNGATFPGDLTYGEWMHIGRVLRTLPGFPTETAMVRGHVAEGLRRVKAAPFNPLHTKSKQEFLSILGVDAASADAIGALPRRTRPIRPDFPHDADDAKEYEQIEMGWWDSGEAREASTPPRVLALLRLNAIDPPTGSDVLDWGNGAAFCWASQHEGFYNLIRCTPPLSQCDPASPGGLDIDYCKRGLRWSGVAYGLEKWSLIDEQPERHTTEDFLELVNWLQDGTIGERQS
jgi:hypothetical protein